MDIQPTTLVCLCAGVQFSDDYDHVRLFDTTAERLNYFNSKLITTITGCTYQRQNKYISVPLLYDTIANCNYLYFQNPDGKYYFAFVNNIEYQNPSTSRVYFDIDVFQTWFTDDCFSECFVEREHVNDDTFGKNIVDEGLDTGPYLYHMDEAAQAGLNEILYVMGVTEIINAAGIPNPPQEGGGMYLGLYSALSYIAFSPDDYNTMANYIQAYSESGKADAIYTLFACPKDLLPGPIFATPTWLRQNSTITGIVANLPKPDSIDGYTPKNNKCFTYPFTSCLATDFITATKELKFELSYNPNNKIRVVIKKSLSPSSQALCTPLNYANGNIDDPYPDYSFNDSFQMGAWPQLAWLNDIYKNWLAQNELSITVSTLTSGITSAIGISTALAASNYAGALNSGISAASNIASTLTSVYQKSIVPDSLHGNSGAGNALIISDDYDLYLIPVTITNDYARRIDNYFNHYGYKVNTFKIPNIRGRQSWNYVKLQDANITLTCPVPAFERIKKIFLDGVTIWHTNDIKNYNLSNQITGA